MHVDLEKFLKRFAQERGLIRGRHLGPSIVPLALVFIEGTPPDRQTYWSPREGDYLVTVSQQHGSIFINADTTKLYSAASGLYGNFEILSINYPRALSPLKLVRVRAKPVTHEPLNWD